jgi:hypothetical protein
MGPLAELLVTQGILGILAGVGFYLFFLERKETRRLHDENAKTIRELLDNSIKDAAAKTKLWGSVEHLTNTVETFWQKADAVWSREAELRAEERGRWEATGKFRALPGDTNGPK